MIKKLAFWGSPGSGKSTAAGILAYTLAEQKKNVVLMEVSVTAPQLSIWLPFHEEINFNRSINSLIREDELTLEKVSGKLVAVTDHLGILGFVRGESPVNSRQIQRVDKFLQIVELISGMEVDYLVFDLNSSILEDVYTIKALEISDRVLRMITPDIRGIVFEQSNLSLLSDSRFHTGEHLRVGGQCKSFHNIGLVENTIGSFHFLLPYCEDIELLGVIGKLFSRFSSKSYSQYQKQLLKAVEGL